jgi:glycosyltransferase involved in cell wall biosynthesis
MRFHYILRTRHNQIVGGVCKKIKSQIQNLRDQGVEVFFHQYDVNINPSENLFTKMRREYRVNTALQDLIRFSGHDDILYFRYPFPSLQLSKILKTPRTCKIVIEHQSIEQMEFRLNGQYLYELIDITLGSAIRRYTDAIVGVTDEITHYELKRSGDPEKPHITIGNGFNVATVKPRKPRPFSGNELSLLCVAHVSRWHGYDRIIEGIAAYTGPGTIKLHIVGTGEEIPHLTEMVERLNLKDRVVFHGFLSGTDLDELFDQCHIAVGSLGIHRKGLHQTSELKVREYSARGIPFILSSTDPDLPPDCSFVFHVPADDTPVSLSALFDFTIGIYRNLQHPDEIHEFALKNLDWSIKMKKLKQFLEDDVILSR